MFMMNKNMSKIRRRMCSTISIPITIILFLNIAKAFAVTFIDTRNGIKTGGTVFHKYNGRLGNELFQWASVSHIAHQNEMSTCMNGNVHESIVDFFDGVDKRCTRPFPLQYETEKGYAKWQQFNLNHKDTTVIGYLQSYKYFDINLRKHLRFKPHLLSRAKVYLEPFQARVLVGIHVRTYEASHLQTPPPMYYENAMHYFTLRYPHVRFIVVCEDPVWCSKQPYFNRENVHVARERQHFAIDMAILSECEHIILSVGTFGWWSAYLGPDSRPDGIVVYYEHEFVTNNPKNIGNVRHEDYYPPHWVSIGHNNENGNDDNPLDYDDKYDDDLADGTSSVSIADLNVPIADSMIHHDLNIGDATIVTAYYKFASKHSSSEYLSWMRNMLSLQDAMVIFTSKEMEQTIYQMRQHARNQTLVIVMELNEAKVVQEYGMDFWLDQHSIDPERHIHPDSLLYIVWNEKPAFVQKAMSVNPFRSSYFLWVDIGALRHSAYNGQFIVTDPSPFRGDKVLMVDPTSQTRNRLNENRISGAMFGGTSTAMERYYNEYYKTLSLGVQSKQFIGKDQLLMYRTCERVSGLCSIILPNPVLSTDSPWFYLVPFLKHKLWLSS
jgi:galactoside 2-L-fucosyltransferase 1/2